MCVTGGAGFIGGHLAETLLDLGASIAIIDDLSTGSADVCGQIVERDPARVDFIYGSILDPLALDQAIDGASVVFHLAAVASVAQSLDDPDRTFAVNANGTLRVAESSRIAGVERLVYAASSSAYGQATPPNIETQPPVSLSPYAASKLAGEQILTSWAASRDLPGVSLRFFNIFGDRQSAESAYAAVIPIFADCLAKNEPLPVHGDGEQTRDFTHVANAIDALLRAGVRELPADGRPINVGCGHGVRVLDLANLLASIMGIEAAQLTFEPERPGDVRDSWADLTRAREILGYEPLLDLDAGLASLAAALKPDTV